MGIRRSFFYALIGWMIFPAGPNVLSAEKAPAKPAPQVRVEKLTILEPTQGRARIIKPSESFYFMFRLDKLDVPKIEVSLVNSLCEEERIRLVAVSPPVAMQVNHWVMLLKAPELTHPGVYDLWIDLGIGYQRVPRAIKVVDVFKERFRFIHLSNMNIGDPTAPGFDAGLINEINLLNPEFIIATGDFLETAGQKNSDKGWRAVKDFLGKFNAPCYMLCGDLDDAETFTTHVTPSLVGTLDYGTNHFFFMMDTSYHPIAQDQLQLKALVNDLTNNKQSRMTFLVGNQDNLGVLDGLTAVGKNPADIFNEGKVRFLIFGGSTDWDYKEYAAKLAAAKLNSVAYIRTGQSSTCMKNGGPGYSKYRIFNVSGSDVSYLYSDGSENGTNPSEQNSVPAGKIRLFYQGPNDGTQKTERVTILNTLDQSFPDCRVIFRLAGSDPQSVKVANGRVERVFPVNKGELMVMMNVGLPEKSSIQVMATTDSTTENQFQKIPVQVDLNVPSVVTFKPARTATGLSFLAAAEILELSLTNPTKEAIRVKPQVTLDGQELFIGGPSQSTQPANDTAGQANEEGIELPPGKTVKLPIKPALRSIKSGKHLVQVYCLNDPLQRVTVFPVQVAVTGQ